MIKRMLAWLIPPDKPPLRPLAEARRFERHKRLQAIDLACDTLGLYKRRADRPYGLRAVLAFEAANGVTADPDNPAHADRLMGAAYGAIHVRYMRRQGANLQRLAATLRRHTSDSRSA